MIKDGKKLTKLKKVKTTPKDIITFSYTSGTTGKAKGALLSSMNFASIVVVARDYGFKENDVHISYLPLPHILERVMAYALISAGGAIGFFNGQIEKLKDDIKVLNPTFFMSVPRLYNKMYQAIKEKVDKLSGMKKKIFNMAFNKKLKNFKNNGSVKSGLWDKLVFKKTKVALGSRCELGGCTSAPISPEILRFLKITLCVPI